MMNKRVRGKIVQKGDQMKKFGKSRAREAWEKLMDSAQRKLSRGASNISKLISWPKGDNWRRKNRKK